MSAYQTGGVVLHPAYVTKEEHAKMIEDLYGVDISVFINLNIITEYSSGYRLHPDKLNDNAHIIKAIREDETGFTAAMYGITDNNKKKE